MTLKLEELEVYQVSMEIGEIAWRVVDTWPFFAKDTLGKQFARAADAIALNISEGDGRFYYKENRNFCYYSRGSAKETTSCLTKAANRKLMAPEDYKRLAEELALYFRLRFSYIKSIGSSKDEGNQP